MRRVIAAGMAVTLAAALLIWGDTAAAAVRQGVELCLTAVLPSLFPFLAVSSWLIALGAGETAQRLLGRPFTRLFRCQGAGAAPFLLGMVGGYPVGARTVAALVQRGTLSPAEGGRLLAFCNNAGPAFIIGIAGRTVFGSGRVGVWLYLLHAATAVAVGLLLRRPAPPTPVRGSCPPPVSPVAAFLDAVQSAAAAMGRLCAFVVFFLVVLAVVQKAVGPLPPWAAGFLELTCGVTALTPDRQGFTLAAGMLGWGGLSVHAQTLAVTADTSIPLGRYLQGKALHSALSALLAWFLWPLV